MIGIITAISEEKESVLKKVKNPKSQLFCGVDFVSGEINGISCVLAMSGVGKINAAKATQLMICKYNLGISDYIINIGSAGATNPIINIGDVVIASMCSQHDVDVTILNERMGLSLKIGQMFGESERFYHTNTTLRKLCRDVMSQIISNSSGYKVYEGPIVTGDKFENSPDKKHWFFKEFGAYCDDMEGAAVVKTANDSGVPSIVIRSISDKPKNEEHVMYPDFSKLAADRATEFLELLTYKINGSYQVLEG